MATTSNMQDLATIKVGYFSFKHPQHWSICTDCPSHAKRDVKFPWVATTTGIQRFMKEDWLKHAFAHATIQLKHTQQQQHTRQLRVLPILPTTRKDFL